MNDLRKNYPIKAILRDTSIKSLESRDKVALHALLTKYKNVHYDEKNDFALSLTFLYLFEL